MQEIFDTLGLNFRDLAWHLVNYVVLLLCLWWIGFRPIMRKLAEREQRVRDQLSRAEAARLEAAQADAVREAILTTARSEADAILTAARSEADTTLARARAEAQLIVADACVHTGDALHGSRS